MLVVIFGATPFVISGDNAGPRWALLPIHEEQDWAPKVAAVANDLMCASALEGVVTPSEQLPMECLLLAELPTLIFTFQGEFTEKEIVLSRTQSHGGNQCLNQGDVENL